MSGEGGRKGEGPSPGGLREPAAPGPAGRPPRGDAQKSAARTLLPSVPGVRPRAEANGTRVLRLYRAHLSLLFAAPCLLPGPAATRCSTGCRTHCGGAAMRYGRRDPHPKGSPVPSGPRAHGEAGRIGTRPFATCCAQV